VAHWALPKHGGSQVAVCHKRAHPPLAAFAPVALGIAGHTCGDSPAGLADDAVCVEFRRSLPRIRSVVGAGCVHRERDPIAGVVSLSML